MQQIEASDAVLLADCRSALLLCVEGSDQLVGAGIAVPRPPRPLAPLAVCAGSHGAGRYVDRGTDAGCSAAHGRGSASRRPRCPPRQAARQSRRSSASTSARARRSATARGHVGFTGAEITRFDPRQSPRPVGPGRAQLKLADATARRRPRESAPRPCPSRRASSCAPIDQTRLARSAECSNGPRVWANRRRVRAAAG
jgi:hypothetical protein